MLTLRQPAARSLVLPLSIAVALIAPFAALEWLTRRHLVETFPVVLFGFMSVHAALIALALTPAVRRLQVARRLGALAPGHWAGLVVGSALIVIYAGVVIDQLPCFLGVPNCD